MGNRRNGVKDKRIKQLVRDRLRRVPNGTKHRRKILQARKLRRRNLASASRHLQELERRYTEGKVISSRERELQHSVSKLMAEGFARARKQTLQLAEALR
jgi:phage terminase Nu1 subunit (DNA packaging protein)